MIPTWAQLCTPVVQQSRHSNRRTLHSQSAQSRRRAPSQKSTNPNNNDNNNQKPCSSSLVYKAMSNSNPLSLFLLQLILSHRAGVDWKWPYSPVSLQIPLRQAGTWLDKDTLKTRFCSKFWENIDIYLLRWNVSLRIMCKITFWLNVVKLFLRLSLFPSGVSSAPWNTVSTSLALSSLTLGNVCLCTEINMLGVPHRYEWFLCLWKKVRIPQNVFSVVWWHLSQDRTQFLMLERMQACAGAGLALVMALELGLLMQAWHKWLSREGTHFKSYGSDVWASGTLKREFSQDI